jgi:hypothetical protein
MVLSRSCCSRSRSRCARGSGTTSECEGLDRRSVCGPGAHSSGRGSLTRLSRRGWLGRAVTEGRLEGRSGGRRWEEWLLEWRWCSGRSGRAVRDEGLCEGPGGGRTGGLRWDVALGAESALLMVAAVWLEYPESLCWSIGRSGGGLSAPWTEGLERFAWTLALGIEGGEGAEGMTTPSSESSQSSTVGWRWAAAETMAAVVGADGWFRAQAASGGGS